ncbi:hypothetical protein GCM10010302_35720 [Streptomyces polychromogenes]|uniref:Uncharacterized protein n=1 Tax=Streptomyces polychromogenes TaxID=67342 RepID=A0ABN0VF38_9ACTN
MSGICANRSVGLAAQSPIVTSAASPEAFISEVVHQPPRLVGAVLRLPGRLGRQGLVAHPLQLSGVHGVQLGDLPRQSGQRFHRFPPVPGPPSSGQVCAWCWMGVIGPGC